MIVNDHLYIVFITFFLKKFNYILLQNSPRTCIYKEVVHVKALLSPDLCQQPLVLISPLFESWFL